MTLLKMLTLAAAVGHRNSKQSVSRSARAKKHSARGFGSLLLYRQIVSWAVGLLSVSPFGFSLFSYCSLSSPATVREVVHNQEGSLITEALRN